MYISVGPVFDLRRGECLVEAVHIVEGPLRAVLAVKHQTVELFVLHLGVAVKEEI